MDAGSVVSSVLEKLGNLLIEETLFLYGVKDEVEWLKDELEWMQKFLIDAEVKRRGGSEVMKHWLKKVREVSHQAEDIIDIFTLEVDDGKSGPLQRFKWMECFLSCFPGALITRHNVGTEILGLKADIDHIKRRKEEYKLSEITPSAATATAADENLQWRRRIQAHEIDTLVVGLDVHKKKIVNHLLDPNDKRRCVVSIVGVGGLGKTTLANKVFNDNKIKAEFDVSACISVSEDYKVHEILKALVKQMMGKTMAELQSEDVDELGGMLREFLMQKRYLILFDDVWSPDVWDYLIRAALPEVNNGSRVLITTRRMDVANSINPTILRYELPFLNKDDSWALFLNRAFPSYQEESSSRCPKELEEIGLRLVERCGGLPLALEVLGGILSSKKANSVAWTSVSEHFEWGSTDKGAECSKILGLSYNNLPHHHLKSCFLYLGVFPEDSEIEAQELIELWIAEGFIPQKHETQILMEDTAHAYLEELADRSMIQVVDKDWLGDSASVKSFRIHDLFRDLCIREAREEDLFNIYNTTTSNSTSTTHLQDTINNNHGKNLRRLVVHGDISTTSSSTSTADLMLPPNLKSVLQFGTCSYNYASSSIIIPNGQLKLLRVIHLVDGVHNLEYEEFPEMFDKMITNKRQLRYLRWSTRLNMSIKMLPACIRNMCNLQTLDLSDLNVSVVPDWLGEIRTLRHLYLDDGGNLFCLGDVGSLTNLQTLDVPIDASEGGWMERCGLEKLLNIRLLLVKNLKEEDVRVFIDSLRKMKYLSTLQVSDAEVIPIELFSDLSENTHLRDLWLGGPIKSVCGSGFPPNLTTLFLYNSELAEDPMPTLEKLPYLRVLDLSLKSYNGKEMVCTSGGFPRLQELELSHLKELEEWRVEDGAMPNLIKLDISNCTKLKTLPEGLQHLHLLRTLTLRGYPQDRVRRDVGEDWYKIQHVPHITLF